MAEPVEPRIPRALVFEKRVLQPLLVVGLWTAFVGALAAACSRLEEAAPLYTWLAASVPFSLAGAYTTLRLEHRRSRFFPRFVETFLLVGLYVLILWQLLPDIDWNFLSMPPDSWRAIAAALLALASWRFAAGCVAQLALPTLVPLQRARLSKEDFHDWAHNYLQANSVARSTGRVKARTTGLAVAVIALGAYRYAAQGAPMDDAGLLLSCLALPMAFLLSSNLYKYELAARWSTEGIRVADSFWPRWLGLSAAFIGIAAAVAVLLPRDYPILSWQRATAEIERFVNSLAERTEPDWQRINREERERLLRRDSKEIEDTSKKQLDQIEEREHGLVAFARIAVFTLFVAFLLAIVGGFAKRAYRYRRVPSLLGLPIALWEILAKFFSFLAFFTKLFFLVFPAAARRREPAPGLRHQLESFAGLGRAALSDEKRREMRTIIDIYIDWVTAAAERGLAFRHGDTPWEFHDTAVRRAAALYAPSRELTDTFYLARFSDEMLGDAAVERARAAAGECRREVEKLPLVK